MRKQSVHTWRTSDSYWLPLKTPSRHLSLRLSSVRRNNVILKWNMIKFHIEMLTAQKPTAEAREAAVTADPLAAPVHMTERFLAHHTWSKEQTIIRGLPEAGEHCRTGVRITHSAAETPEEEGAQSGGRAWAAGSRSRWGDCPEEDIWTPEELQEHQESHGCVSVSSRPEVESIWVNGIHYCILSDPL